MWHFKVPLFIKKHIGRIFQIASLLYSTRIRVWTCRVHCSLTFATYFTNPVSLYFFFSGCLWSCVIFFDPISNLKNWALVCLKHMSRKSSPWYALGSFSSAGQACCRDLWNIWQTPINGKVIEISGFIKCQTERAAHNNAESQCYQSIIRPQSLTRRGFWLFSSFLLPLWQTRRTWRCSPLAASLARMVDFSNSGMFRDVVVLLWRMVDVTWKPQWDVKALLRRWNLKPATYISYTYNEDLISLTIFTSDCSNSPACFWSCQNQWTSRQTGGFLPWRHTGARIWRCTSPPWV